MPTFSILIILIYIVHTILTGYFEELHKLIVKSTWIYQGPKRQSNLEGEAAAGGLALPYIKAHHEPNLYSTVLLQGPLNRK